MREGGSIGSRGNGIRISREIINGLRAPEVEAQLQVERSLDRLVQAFETQAPGLVLNLCRELTGTTGEPITVHAEDLNTRLRSNYSEAQVAAVLQQFSGLGMLNIQNGVVRLQSGVLSKLIHANVQAQTAELQKIEAFIANRYDYFLEKGQLLSEQDIQYINPYLGDIVLDSGPKEFIEKSRQAIKRQKRKGAIILASVIAILALLTVLAVYFAIRAMNNADEVGNLNSALNTLNEDLLDRNSALAESNVVKDRLVFSADSAREAAIAAEKDATLKGEQLKVANIQIGKLLDNEKQARKFAEEQKTKALESVKKIDSLNAELNKSVILATNEAISAKAARDVAKQEKDISEELRNILLSRIVAKRSLAMKEGDEDLKAYTAMLAYYVNESSKTNGDVSHPDVFRATYYAAKNLGSTAIPPATSLAAGAIGSILCDNASCITGASDGSVVQFVLNQSSAGVQSLKRIFNNPHDAIHYVFPQKSDSGSQGSIFVLGAFDHILEISNPARGSDMATQLGRVEIPEKQFVKSASRISDTELLVQATDGSVYRFDCVQRSLTMLLDPAVGVVACAVLREQNLMCFATTENELYLDNFGADRLRETRLQYARAKKRVAQMQLKQYGDATYLAVAYLDGELEVFIAKDQAFLNVYQSRSQGKGGYQIQSLRSSVHTGFIPELVFAESKPRLAVCSYDGTVSVWDLHKWEQRSGDYQPLILDDHGDWVTSCVFLPGDNTIITGSKLGTLKFWYLDTGKYAEGLCNGIRRSPTEDEWNEYIGEGLKDFKGKFCSGK